MVPYDWIYPILRQREAAAGRVAEIQRICARFRKEAVRSFVEACRELKIERQRHRFAFARCELSGFRKSQQAPLLVIHPPVRFLHEQQQGFPPHRVPGVSHRHHRRAIRRGFDRLFKRRIAQTVPERVADGDAPGLEPAIAHVDAFVIVLVFQVAVSVPERVCRRIVPIRHSPRIGQSAGRIYPAGQNIRQGAAALHAALSHEQHGVDAGFLQDRKVDHAAAVQHQDQLSILRGKRFEALLLHVGKQIIARFDPAVPALPRLTGQDIDSGVGFFRQLVVLDRRARGIGHGLFADSNKHLHGARGTEALDRRLNALPPRIDVGFVFGGEPVHPEGRRERESRVFQPPLDRYAVSFAHFAAARAALDRHATARTVQGDPARLDRQDAVVFQQDNPFRRRLPRQSSMIPLPLRFFRGRCAEHLIPFHERTSTFAVASRYPALLARTVIAPSCPARNTARARPR